jgi:hypothetical protein
MKANKILFIFLVFNIKSYLNQDNNSNLKKIRNLWVDPMEYEKRDNGDDNNSLKRCTKSSFKYFSFILSGAPVTFDHSVNVGNVVS